jgi:exopolyphosphatase/guanosine-5'-triphosphate,3'-diphosphate pyrophosphatase
VGSGGNINKIAKLFGDRDQKIIKLKQFEKIYKSLSGMSVAERMHTYNLRADRADVIVPASEIFLKIMKTIKANSIIAPKIGLTDGLVVSMYKRYQSEHNKN